MRTLSERQCYVNRETEMENMMNERNAKDTIDKKRTEKKQSFSRIEMRAKQK